MREAIGNLWTYQPADVRVITTNGDVNQRGQAVMGRGVALQATQIFRTLRETLAAHIEAYGNRCFRIGPDFHTVDGALLVSFPVKHHWQDAADYGLIEQSARELVEMADKFHWQHVVLPRPGCGNGRRDWTVVQGIIAPIFDDRFVVLAYDSTLS